MAAEEYLYDPQGFDVLTSKQESPEGISNLHRWLQHLGWENESLGTAIGADWLLGADAATTGAGVG